MATAEELRVTRYAEHIGRLKEAMDYLQEVDPRDFSEEEYDEIEQAIWRIWVWRGLRDQLRGYVVDVEHDVQACLKDLRSISGDIHYHVDRSQHGRGGHRRLASSRYYTHFAAKKK